jgi:hypothetical protein
MSRELNYRDWEDVKCLCFVSESRNEPGENQSMNSVSPAEYNTQSGKKLKISPYIREHATDVLFEPDDEDISISTQVLDCVLKVLFPSSTYLILKAPIDIRKELISNIMLIGGVASIPGFNKRFLYELRRKLVYDKRYLKMQKLQGNINLVSSIFPAVHCAWTGASLIGGLSGLKGNAFEMDKNSYELNSCIPDWSSL